MLTRKDYFPRKKFKLKLWAEEFAKEVAKNATDYNISTEEAEALKTCAENYSNDLENERLLINKKLAQVKKTQANRKKLEKISRALTQRIKTSANYSSVVGAGFGIIGAERDIDVAKSKPVLKERKLPHGWQFSFNLHAYFSGVNIYKKRPEDEDFSFLATDTQSPYVDNSDIENGTEYFAYYIIGDKEVGLASDITVIEV